MSKIEHVKMLVGSCNFCNKENVKICQFNFQKICEECFTIIDGAFKTPTIELKEITPEPTAA